MNPVPKPAPHWLEKAQRKAAEAREIKACYASVDARDGHRCRVCSHPLSGIGMLDVRHRHHLVYRSKGGAHDPANVISVCVKCHRAIHDAEIRLSGDANARAVESGTLCGVKLERFSEGGWKVERHL